MNKVKSMRTSGKPLKFVQFKITESEKEQEEELDFEIAKQRTLKAMLKLGKRDLTPKLVRLKSKEQFDSIVDNLRQREKQTEQSQMSMSKMSNKYNQEPEKKETRSLQQRVDYEGHWKAHEEHFVQSRTRERNTDYEPSNLDQIKTKGFTPALKSSKSVVFKTLAEKTDEFLQRQRERTLLLDHA